MVLVLDLAPRARAALGWWMWGILGMAAYAVSAYEWISGLEEISRLYQQYPPALRKLFGDGDLGTLNGWLHGELLSRVVVGLWNIFVICLGVFAVLVAGVAIIGHTPSAGNYALAMANAFLLSAALLAAYVAVAAAAAERARGAGITPGRA